MADSLESRSELVREQGLSGVEFLALLIDDEINRRRSHKDRLDRKGLPDQVSEVNIAIPEAEKIAALKSSSVPVDIDLKRRLGGL